MKQSILSIALFGVLALVSCKKDEGSGSYGFSANEAR